MSDQDRRSDSLLRPLHAQIFPKKAWSSPSTHSMHSVRHALLPYVQSQRQEGWRALETHYDDGGFSGGSMERPALKQLPGRY